MIFQDPYGSFDLRQQSFDAVFEVVIQWTNGMK